jgi:Rrf2 family protein
MRLSNKTVYALRALFDLAYHGGEGPVQLREIAEREKIPMSFLEQIFGDLKRANLVRSKRGPKGGYELDQPPESITLTRIFEALDALPHVPELCDDGEGEGDARAAGEAEADLPCSVDVTDALWPEILAKFREILDETNLADLMRRGEELGVGRDCYERFVYVI